MSGSASARDWLIELGRRELRPGAFSLEPVGVLLGRLGNPHHRFGALHVAGTRGKGSTCALLASALGAAGLRIGLTTSPHLLSPCERIRVDGHDVEEERLWSLAARVREACGDLDPGYFEVMTAAAFLAFAEDEVDLAVVEVGLGGRLDATNVVRPLACAITRLGMDHADRLGPTRAAVAREKAGILKPGVPAVVAPGHPEAIEAVLLHAASMGAPVRLLSPEDVRDAPRCALPGAVQAENAAVAAALLDELAATRPDLAVTPEARDRGFMQVRWRARLELLPAALSEQPRVDLLLDVAHDVDSVAALCAHLGARRAAALVFSCLAGKDLDGMARLLADSEATRGARIVVPELPAARARPASDVVATLRAAGLDAVAARGVHDALDQARRMGRSAAPAPGVPPVVAAFGSFVLAGEVLREVGAR